MTPQQLNPPHNVEYKQLFDQSNDACVIFKTINNKPKIIKANDSFKETFCGTTQESLNGTNLNELIVPEDKQEEAKRLDQKTINNKINEETIKRQTNTGIKTFVYRGIPLQEKKGFGIYIDISDRIQQQQYIDVLQRILRHNFRNELGVIRGNSKAALSQTNTEEVTKHVKTSFEAAERLNKLIEESDIIREIINSHGNVKTTEIQLNSILETAITNTTEQFESDPTVTLECDETMTVKASGKLQHAFEALIDNSIRHNDIKDPTVEVICRAVSDKDIQIEISDNGPGIPVGDKKIITGDGKASPLEHGSWLGLWVARWITENSNGTITVQTRRHTVGTTILITLPRVH